MLDLVPKDLKKRLRLVLGLSSFRPRPVPLPSSSDESSILLVPVLSGLENDGPVPPTPDPS